MANNPLYNQQMQQNGLMSQFQAFSKNPIQYLVQKKVNIPQNLQNNPREAVQYLLNNGQMSQNTLNRLTQTANQLGIQLK